MSEAQTATRTPDLVKLSKKLQGIGTIEKCEGCSCYIDTIKEFDAVLQQVGDDAPEEAHARVAELDAKHQTTHGCIGCDPCYPVGVSNQLYEISGGKSVDDEALATAGCCDVPATATEAKAPTNLPLATIEAKSMSESNGSCGGASCGCDAPVAPVALPTIEKKEAITTSWTVETGDYRLGNPTGAVAIATLASEDLYKHFSDEMCADDCSICGKVFTENIGIEKVVKNIIANRHIRFLILCGEEAKGHQTGACIMALHKGGINERSRIADAPGKRPFIKTLTPAQVSRFQSQVEIVDMIGCEDVETIEAVAAELAARNPGAMPDNIIAEGVPHYIASDKVKLKLDRAGFLIIHPKPEANWILVEHYENSGKPTCVIEGSDPAVICAELIERGLVSQLDHAAYLGRELERAKLSMQLGFAFAQDRALGELDLTTVPEW